jgi:DnaJ domain
MFDRSRSGSDGPLCVEITLDDGRRLTGKLLVPPGRSLTEALNGAATFMEFESFSGERTFIAKLALRVVKPMQETPAPILGAGLHGGNGFNPFSILGVSAEAGRDEVRQAYLRLAKTYHPDRYAAADLPAEVREYLAAMARRINAAWDAAEVARQKPAARPEPAFTSTSGK